MSEEKKMKKAVILADFKDTNFDHSGIERNFTAGKIVEMPEDVFTNYEHGGLVREATSDDKTSPADDAKAAGKTATKTTDKAD